MTARPGMARMRWTLFAGGAGMALIACGAESNAADSGTAVSASGEAAAPEAGDSANLSQPGRAAATTVPALPIEQGLYAHSEEGCARARSVTFYQDRVYGSVSMGEANPSVGRLPGVSADPIRRVGPGRAPHLSGFTNAWFDDRSTDLDGDVSVRPLGRDRFVLRYVSYGSGHVGGRVDVSDSTHLRCAFTQLLPGMQAAIRRYRPQLAPGGGQAPEATTDGSVTFPPIPQGFYARNRNCRAVLAEATNGGSSDLVKFNQQHFFHFDGGPIISAFETLGENRFRVKALLYDENENSTNADFVITVTGAGSFTTDATARAPAERFTHCPDSQVPRSVREEYEF